MSPACKMADNGRLIVDQKVEVVLFYAETKSVVATQRRFVHTLVQGGLLANRQFTDFHYEQFSSLWRLILYQMSNAFVKIEMCYVYNQWYDISCATTYMHIYIYIYVFGCIIATCSSAHIRPAFQPVSMCAAIYWVTEVALWFHCYNSDSLGTGLCRLRSLVGKKKF